jgi:group I intron endonuclease
MIGYIYKITNPSGKIYVGQTIDINERQRKYKYANCKNQTRLYRSLLKYGWENHIFEVIQTAELCDLNRIEIEWIDKLNCFTKGLNCTVGGQGISGMVYSEETRLKMRNSHLGKKQSQETIDKRVEKLKGQKRSDSFKERLSQIHTGRVLSEETKKKLRDINTGKKLSEDVKQKISNSSKGRIVSEETKKRISEARRAGILKRKNDTLIDKGNNEYK